LFARLQLLLEARLSFRRLHFLLFCFLRMYASGCNVCVYVCVYVLSLNRHGITRCPCELPACLPAVASCASHVSGVFCVVCVCTD